ncbi:MAG: hypothetical protein MI976_12635 [Pseudomonadales bacterium]|nr:hypothetical protein [Pseudomonadales bacterium]
MKQPDTDPNLSGYRHGVAEWLRSSNDFPGFVADTTVLLERLGFPDWSYCRLDLPLSQAEPVGTFFEPYHEDDLMFMTLRDSHDPVHRIDVNRYLQQAGEETGLETPWSLNNRDMVIRLKRREYYNMVGIPVWEEGCKNHAMVNLTAKRLHPSAMKRLFIENLGKINIVVNAIDQVGCKHYAVRFLGLPAHYDIETQTTP